MTQGARGATALAFPIFGRSIDTFPTKEGGVGLDFAHDNIICTASWFGEIWKIELEKISSLDLW